MKLLRWPLRIAHWALIVLCAAVFAAGLHWGTFAVGGSDSYCYVHQAERADGPGPEAVALAAPWPDATLTFTPSGHVPSKAVAGAFVPLCPIGLSLVMKPFRAIGGSDAVFLVVPLFGALLVAATYVVGSRHSVGVGLAAALTTAASPAFLFQLFQPMSDVPAAALWVLAIACATSTQRLAPAWAGLATSLAILIRPNLLPLGIVVGLALLLRTGQAWRERMLTAAKYAGASAIGCVAVGAIQHGTYGSALSSGYGSLETIFSLANVPANAQRYLAWMLETHTPLWLLALPALVLLRTWRTALLGGVILANVVAYLPYTVFDEWWYLRFLLPAIPLLLVLMCATVNRVAGRVPVAVLATVLAILFVREARERQAFDLERLESRYVTAGQFVAKRLPENAFVITSWQSGSVRYYSGRRTLVWDVLDPAWLDRAIAFAREQGFEPYLLFERWEEQEFRRRFSDSALGALDWPPTAEIGSQVRIYRPADRQRYVAGENVNTEFSR